MYEMIFNQYLSDLESDNKVSPIYRHLIDLDWVSKEYLRNSLPAEKVRDFLAGMTDRYFEDIFKQIIDLKRVKDFGA